MPGKLAAARASREATGGFATLPRRAGSTQSGLSPELEDASAGDASATFGRVSGPRLLRNGSTEVAASPKQQHEGHASSQSVTFHATSGPQAHQHGTPTASAAALELQNHVLAGATPPLSSAPRSLFEGPNSAPGKQRSGELGPRSCADSLPDPAARSASPSPCPSPGPGTDHTADQQQQSTVWSASAGSSRAGVQQRPAAQAQAYPTSSGSVGGPVAAASQGGLAVVAAGGAGLSVAEQPPPALAPPSTAACTTSAAHSAGAGEGEQMWTAAASGERLRSGTIGSIPLRQSRLRSTVLSSGPGLGSGGQALGGSAAPAAGSLGDSGRRGRSSLSLQDERDPASGASSSATYNTPSNVATQLSRGGSIGGPGLLGFNADSIISQGPASSAGIWTAAAGAGRPHSTADISSNGGAALAMSTTGPNSLAFSRRAPGGGPRGAPSGGSELFPDLPRTEEGLPSAESSFTVRQTPSDIEDEVLDRARTRRAMRSVTLASMRLGPGQAGCGAADGRAGGPSEAGGQEETPATQGQRPSGDAGARMVIRLNHQPGHHRRPPNRHASMPAMKQEGPGGVAGPAGMRRSPLRPPLSSGLLPEEESVPEDSMLEGGAAEENRPSGGSMRSALGGNAEEGHGGEEEEAEAGASVRGGNRGSGGPADASSRGQQYSRMPSESPVTSQLSVTSSIINPGPGSTAGQRYQLLRLSGSVAATAAAAAPPPGGSAATAAGLAHAQPASPPRQLRLGGPGTHSGAVPGLLVRLPDLGIPLGGSSGQRPSFEEDLGRPTPTLLGISGATPAGGLPSHPQLANSSLGLVVDRPSHMSGRLLSGAHAQTHSSNLAALHKAVERLMLQDSGLYAKVQASMKGISSLAKETNKLEFVRDASGATVINQYVVVKTLGRGSFGKVKLCLNTLDGQLYAVKMINRAHLLRQLQKPSRPLRRRAPPPRNTSDTGLMNLHRTQTDGNLSISHTNISNFGNAAQAAAPARASMDDTSPLAAIMREIAVMKKVDHPHVVRLHEVIDPPGSSYLMMVMEYCEGGCIMETRAQTGLTPLGEDAAREYFRQACLGLDYLHYNNVIHGDLKPENMLVSGEGLLKIADFGSSRFMGGDPTDATKTSCTPAFQSPEEIGHMTVDPFAADLWALACCLFCFVFGRLPFVGSCVVDIYRAILTRPHTYPEEVSCSPALRNLLDRMLDKDPANRLALREVGHHEWVTAGGQLPPLQFLQSLAGGTGGEAPPPVIHVTHAEQVNAIDRSSLVSLIRARLKEKTCQPGEYLFKEGEEAHCVYMIMAGVVELTQHLRRPAAAGLHGAGPHGAHGHGASGGGAAGGYHGGEAGDGASADLHDASFSVDLDESLTLDHAEAGHLTEGLNIVDGKLHIDRQQAIEMRRRMQGQLLGENAEYVVEVKGPGSVIGEIGMDTAATAMHRVSARARGPVTVVKLTEENFFKALLQMYGGGGAGGPGGGSAASTTLTTSSVSEAVGGKGGGAASTGPPGLSAQQLMVMQYLEDSGSYAVFPAAAPSTASAGPGRFSMDAGASPSSWTGRPGQHGGSLNHHHHHPHPHNTNSPTHAAAGNGNSTGGYVSTGMRAKATAQLAAAAGLGGSTVVSPSAAAAAAAAAAATGAPTAAALQQSSRGLAGTSAVMGTKHSGVNSMLGVLNTIHSINASRAGGTSEEGVADL